MRGWWARYWSLFLCHYLRSVFHMMYQLPKGALYVILMKTRLLFEWLVFVHYTAGPISGIALEARYSINYISFGLVSDEASCLKAVSIF